MNSKSAVIYDQSIGNAIKKGLARSDTIIGIAMSAIRREKRNP
jgi:hypothetical protein